MTREGVAAAAQGRDPEAWDRGIPEGTPYRYLHILVESEIEAAYSDGMADGYVKGHEEGWRAGHVAGLLTPDPPPEGSTAYRALERETIRQAFAPSEDSLAEAVRVLIRDMDRKHARDAARTTDRLPEVIYVPPGEPLPDQNVTPCQHGEYACRVCDRPARVHQNADYGASENGQNGGAS